MGILDSVLGGLGDDTAEGLSGLLKGEGGVGGLVEKFAASGLGDVAASWISTNANAAITPEQLEKVLGHGPIGDFAKKLGVTPEEASKTLAGLLPEAIDRLTPNGKASDADDLLKQLPGGLGNVLGGFLKR